MLNVARKDDKRSEWEIKEDLETVTRALAIFKNKDRLKDVKDLIQANKSAESSLDALMDGDVKLALGL